MALMNFLACSTENKDTRPRSCLGRSTEIRSVREQEVPQHGLLERRAQDGVGVPDLPRGEVLVQQLSVKSLDVERRNAHQRLSAEMRPHIPA